MEVRCVVDGKPFEAKRASAKYCSERCKKRAQRDPERSHIGPASGTAEPVAPVVRLAAADSSPAAGTGVWRLTHDTLEANGRLGTVAGAVSLALAMKLDDPGLDTGSSVAAVARQLHASMALALEGITSVEDPVDSILSRRRRSA